MTLFSARLATACLAAIAGLLSAACGKDDPPAIEPPKADCGYHSDCPGGVCFEGKCEGTAACFERAQCVGVPVCAGHRCICDQTDNRCLPVCITDDDCPSDGQCLNGVCTRYEPQLAGQLPGGGAQGNLQVGLARVELDFPMGVSMAGYGTRRGPRTPYQNALGGSNAWFDKPDVRAIVFDDGRELFVLLRIPLSWTTDYLLTGTALKVQERTGLNLIDHIVTSAPHSHSHPARFWHLVVGLNFGIFGYDEFSYEIWDRLTTSFADAIELALNARQPARFGWTVIEDFDPNNRIHRDRRQQNNQLPGYVGKDDRMLIARVDDLDGNPLAIFTHFGVHGTVFGYDNPILTMDAPGGVEVELTRRASEKYGRSVMGVYLQGNAGDISPGGDDLDNDELERIQLLGYRAWQVIEPAIDGIETRADVEVGVISGRIPITHQVLGYGEGEFFDTDAQCEDSETYFRFGAFQCVEGEFRDEDPATQFTDGDLNCVFAVECLTAGYPIPQFQKTRLSIARLGDLALPTMPGEPLSQFGLDVAARVKEASGVRDAFVLGYSQDHHFYLLNEDDWLQGGYEPSRDIWGWKLGPYLADRSEALARELRKAPGERVFEQGNLKPMWWPSTELERMRIEATETEGDPAAVRVDVPARVERLELVTFAWAGGHPGVDRPRIVLEREENGVFSPVRRPGGDLYDDSMFEMLVHYEGECSRRNCDAHQWRVDWEEGRDFPLGKYRLRAEGRALKGGAVVDYQAASSAFDLVASTKLEIYGLSVQTTGIEGRLVDPRSVRFVPEGEELVAKRIGHRMRSPLVPRQLGAPLPDGMAITASGSVRAPDGTSTAITGAATLAPIASEARQIVRARTMSGTPIMADAGAHPTTRFELPVAALQGGAAGDYVLELVLTDPLGNSGTLTATITK